jgi:hypothetical protein
MCAKGLLYRTTYSRRSCLWWTRKTVWRGMWSCSDWRHGEWTGALTIHKCLVVTLDTRCVLLGTRVRISELLLSLTVFLFVWIYFTSSCNDINV